MKKFLLFFGILIIIAVLIAGYAFKMIFLEQKGDGNEKVFIIESGQGVNQISQNLYDQDLIDNMFIFETWVWLKKSEEKMIAGEHKLIDTWSMNQLINVLTSGQTVEKEKEITIIEGWNLRDIANYLEKQGIVPQDELYKLTGEPLDLDSQINNDFSDDHQLLKAKPINNNYEGFLYPDTYRIFKDAAAEDVLNKMFTNFENKITDQILADINSQGKNLYDILILASIVEREGQGYEEMQNIAGVYNNRLEIGMALQSDPTVNYVTGKKDSRPLLADLDIDNPYNTYEYPGLPPGPICNPGIDAIKATVYFSEHNYLYFLHDEDGGIHFAETFEGHKRNRDLYF